MSTGHNVVREGDEWQIGRVAADERWPRGKGGAHRREGDSFRRVATADAVKWKGSNGDTVTHGH